MKHLATDLDELTVIEWVFMRDFKHSNSNFYWNPFWPILRNHTKHKYVYNSIDFANAGFFYSHPRMQGLQVAVIFWIV